MGDSKVGDAFTMLLEGPVQTVWVYNAESGIDGIKIFDAAGNHQKVGRCDTEKTVFTLATKEFISTWTVNYSSDQI